MLRTILFVLTIIQCCVGPPVTKSVDKEQQPESDGLEEYMEYHRYLREVVSALESDPEFKKKLETASEDDIKSGKIAHELEFVSHHVRTRLDEIKRTELERLKELTEKKKQLMENNSIDDPTHHHLDHENLHTFEIEDLKKLIAKTTADLAEADRKRREEFKEYEMQKEFEKQRKLNETDGEERTKLEQQFKGQEQTSGKEYEEKHKKHQKLHEPVHKQQLEEVWEEQDHMQQEFDPKTFFVLHDLDGNGLWDENEVKALFVKELDKMYQEGAPEDDMRERMEEMERMRETVFGEVDTNRDGFIDYQEFLAQTKRNDFQQDHGWQGLDEQKVYTDEELKEYIAMHQKAFLASHQETVQESPRNSLPDHIKTLTGENHLPSGRYQIPLNNDAVHVHVSPRNILNEIYRGRAISRQFKLVASTLAQAHAQNHSNQNTPPGSYLVRPSGYKAHVGRNKVHHSENRVYSNGYPGQAHPQQLHPDQMPQVQANSYNAGNQNMPPYGGYPPPGAYHVPPPGYQAHPGQVPPGVHQVPPAGYQVHPGDYHVPPGGYQVPPGGYHVPPGGYHPNEIPHGYQGQAPPQQFQPGQLPQAQVKPQNIGNQMPPQGGPNIPNYNQGKVQDLNTNEIYPHQQQQMHQQVPQQQQQVPHQQQQVPHQQQQVPQQQQQVPQQQQRVPQQVPQQQQQVPPQQQRVPQQVPQQQQQIHQVPQQQQQIHQVPQQQQIPQQQLPVQQQVPVQQVPQYQQVPQQVPQQQPQVNVPNPAQPNTKQGVPQVQMV